MLESLDKMGLTVLERGLDESVQLNDEFIRVAVPGDDGPDLTDD